MSNLARSGAYAVQKRQVVALEDAETRVQMGLDPDFRPEAEDDATEAEIAAAFRPEAGDERVLNAARAL